MGRRKITAFNEIQNKVTKTVTYNKRKRGIIKKAAELSLLCGQDIMLAIYNKVNNKFVMYQSSPDFNPTKVNLLLESEKTKGKLYEEHTNIDFTAQGSKKTQTFHFRLDSNHQVQQTNLQKRPKLHWKIQYDGSIKSPADSEKQKSEEINSTDNQNEDNEEEFEPVRKVQKLDNTMKKLPQTELVSISESIEPANLQISKAEYLKSGKDEMTLGDISKPSLTFSTLELLNKFDKSNFLSPQTLSGQTTQKKPQEISKFKQKQQLDQSKPLNFIVDSPKILKESASTICNKREEKQEELNYNVEIQNLNHVGFQNQLAVQGNNGQSKLIKAQVSIYLEKQGIISTLMKQLENIKSLKEQLLETQEKPMTKPPTNAAGLPKLSTIKIAGLPMAQNINDGELSPLTPMNPQWNQNQFRINQEE